MAAANEDTRFEQVVRTFEPASELLRVSVLEGGVSAQVAVMELALPDGATKKLILRRHGAVDLAHNPHIAADEFRLLQIIRAAGVPAPSPYYLDQSCEIFPTPYLIIEYIEGATEFAPANLNDYIRQFAAQLARIHAIDNTKTDLSFLPKAEQVYARRVLARPASVDASFEEERVRDILEAVLPLPQHNAPVLLHGDYWLGNILWRDGRIAGVIDWEDAKVGDPVADLACSRLETFWAFGFDAMQQFTQEYIAQTGIDCTALPYWDLCVSLQPMTKIAEWASDAAAEQTMRDRLRQFIMQALEQVDGR